MIYEGYKEYHYWTCNACGFPAISEKHIKSHNDFHVKYPTILEDIQNRFTIQKKEKTKRR